MVLRLFDFNRAPNPRRVRIFLAEKGVAVPLVPVNLYRHEQRSPAFLAINPGGTVPVLELDDGTRLSECLAICRYLEHLHPEPRLFGGSPRQEALVLMWSGIVDQEGQAAAAEALRNLSPGFRDHALPGPVPHAQLPALVERGLRRLEAFFDRIEGQLATSAHLAGEAFSYADISLLVAVDFAGWVDVVPMRTRPALARWYARVSARASSGA